jgi:polysaccharide export outer membrane protein
MNVMMLLLLGLAAIGAGPQNRPPDTTAPSSIAQPPAAAAPDEGAPPQAAGYVIGPQDVLQITVFDEPDLTNKYRVDADGYITFPLISRVPASGMTIGEFQNLLRKQLAAGYLKNPQVRVDVDQYKSQNVYVIGEVRNPGRITMTGTTMTLLEALALAGSPTSSASGEVIVVHPARPSSAGAAPPPDADKNGETIHINRKDLELGRAGRDVVLRDGDIINVPVAQRFYISGYVRNPGYYVLDPGMTVQQAIAVAGGLTDRGSDRRIKATRTIKNVTLDLDVNLEDKVQPNDTIKVPARFF